MALSVTSDPSVGGGSPRTPLVPAKTTHDFVARLCDPHHYH
jgi:hypothetical protein